MKNYIGILKLTKAKYRLAIATIVDKTNYQSLDNVFIKEIQKNKYNEIILNGDHYVGKCYADIFITNYHSNIFKQANIKLSDMLVTINVSKISKYVKTYVEKAGFNLLREFQGHGIGREMHEDPGVPNIGKSGRGPRLEKGMALAIEPMVTEGSPDVCVAKDKWTIKTKDGKLTAYYENTIVITDGEPEILTLY